MKQIILGIFILPSGGLLHENFFAFILSVKIGSEVVEVWDGAEQIFDDEVDRHLMMLMMKKLKPFLKHSRTKLSE